MLKYRILIIQSINKKVPFLNFLFKTQLVIYCNGIYLLEYVKYISIRWLYECNIYLEWKYSWTEKRIIIISIIPNAEI